MVTAYLLTWNPNLTAWDDLEVEAQETAEGQICEGRWSCGNTKRILPGDRLYLLRQGGEPRGIVASGWSSSAPYEGPHRDDTRNEKGDTALYIDVRYDRIPNPEFDDPLPLSLIKSGRLTSVNWSTQRSGIEIKDGVEDLERLWLNHLQSLGTDSLDDLSAIEGAVSMASRRHRVRERKLRHAKLAEAKRINGDRLPCEACRFDFFEVYGEIGRDFAHVHHLRPLGEMTCPSRTTLDDLAIICANCRAMIHRDGGSLPLNNLLKPRQFK